MNTQVCTRCNWLLPDDLSGCSTVDIHGGYGMFHDDFANGCVIETKLCHGCTVKLFQFMKLSGDEFNGSHPYMNEDGESQSEPCCEYGWGSVYEEGKWVGITYGFDTDTVHYHKETT